MNGVHDEAAIIASLAKRIAALERAASRTDPTLDARLDALEPGDWETFTYQNSWTAYTTGGYQTPGSLDIGGGLVLLRGAITGGANGSIAFTLPVGKRPPATIELTCSTWTTGGTNYTTGVLVINSAGECRGYRYGTTPSYMNISGNLFSTVT